MGAPAGTEAAHPTLRTADELRRLLAETQRRRWCVFATASWCVPCRRLHPAWEDVASPDNEFREFGFAVADLSEESEQHLDGGSLSELLSIDTLPTFVLLDGSGREVARAVGAAHKRPARRLVGMLREALRSEAPHDHARGTSSRRPI